MLKDLTYRVHKAIYLGEDLSLLREEVSSLHRILKNKIDELREGGEYEKADDYCVVLLEVADLLHLVKNPHIMDMYDNIYEQEMKEEKEMKNEIIVIETKKEDVKMNTFIGKVKVGFDKFSNSKFAKGVKKVVKASYEFAKDLVKDHWKDFTLASTTTIAAGSVIGGFGGLVGGFATYIAFKFLLQVINHYLKGGKIDLIDLLGDAFNFPLYLMVFILLLVFVFPTILNGAILAWAYALIWVLA